MVAFFTSVSVRYLLASGLGEWNGGFADMATARTAAMGERKYFIVLWYALAMLCLCSWCGPRDDVTREMGFGGH